MHRVGASVHHEEATVHHVVKDSIESLCEYRLRASQHDKIKGKEAGNTNSYSKYPIDTCDEMAWIGMNVAAKHGATWAITELA